MLTRPDLIAPTRPATLRFVKPQIPTLVTEPLAGDGWLHEVKYDGKRTQLLLDCGTARAFTRRGFDWSDRYAPICAGAAALPCRTAVLDGEVIVQDDKGRSDFVGLRRAIKREPHRLVFVAFDLLHLDRRDLPGLPLLDRLTHHCDIIETGNESWRFKNRA